VSEAVREKIAICFLVPGCLYVPAPERFAKMTATGKAAWAQGVLEESSDQDLACAVATSEEGGFDETPDVAAVEDASGSALVTTPAWKAYTQKGAFTLRKARATE